MKNNESPFAVDLDTLSRGPHAMEVREPPESLDLATEGFAFNDEVTGNLTYRIAGTDVSVLGRLSVRATADCIRCLEPSRHEVGVQVALVCVSGSPDDLPELDEAGEPMVVDYYSGDVVDPSAAFRDLLLLALPNLPLCDSECKGLCPRCGANLNRETCACGDAKKDEEGKPENWKSKLRQLRIDGDE